MNQQYQHNRTSVTLLNYHFVWIPARRRKVLTGSVAGRLQTLIYDVAADLGCTVIALEVMPDHVHLFLSATPTLAPDQIMFRIKGSTSRTLRQEFPHLLTMPSMWTRSYFCSTAGQVASETIRQYIATQRTR